MKACLSQHKEEALENFNLWLDFHGFEVEEIPRGHILPTIYDSLEMGSKKLLPLVYKNFKQLGVEHRAVQQFEGYYKHTWYKNQLLRKQCTDFTQMLNEANIDYFLTKGLPLITRYYQDFGARPTSDIDMVIKQENWEETVTLLEKSGWKPLLPHRDHRKIPASHVLHALTFVKGNFQLDLHWRFSHSVFHVNWSKAEIFQYVENPTKEMRCLNDTLNFILIIVHGVKLNPMRPIRWVTDAVNILRTGNINWDTVYRFAQDNKLKSPLFEALQYLNEKGFCTIPNQVLTDLSNTKKVDFFSLMETRLATKFQFLRATYLSFYLTDNPIAGLRLLKRHYQYTWNCDSNIILLILILKKINTKFISRS
ncbi:hypothetical protein GCM10023331_18790 [Algivirga pacifica]|uniref:Nucleotidyltransferase n=1 Tax=Algivirga pacifica TaxID=1162670 RepID=A0ABP9D8C9_9BACT